MASGGVLAAIGAILLLIGIIKRRLFVLFIGAFGLALVLAITFAIWSFRLAPSDVKKPLPIILSGILVLVLLAYIWFVLNEIQQKIENQQKID